MNREVHVRFCEGVGVKFPRATRPLIHTFAVWIYLPYIVATELEIALHPLDAFFLTVVENSVGEVLLLIASPCGAPFRVAPIGPVCAGSVGAFFTPLSPWLH